MVKSLIIGLDNPYLIFGEKNFFKAKKRLIYYHYLNVSDYFTENITIQTLEGRATATVADILVIGIKGEVWPLSKELFKEKYNCTDAMNISCLAEEGISKTGILIKFNSKEYRFQKEELKNPKVCYPSEQATVDAFQLQEAVQLKTAWGIYQAKKGDYLLVNSINDYYSCDQEIFDLTYEIIK